MSGGGARASSAREELHAEARRGPEQACVGRRSRPHAAQLAAGRAARPIAVFSFLYLKKIKISEIYVCFENFRKYTPVARPRGDRTLM